MKGFIITTSLFVIMAALISANYYYVNNVSNSMLDIVSEISETPSESNQALIKQLQEKYQESRDLLSISICTKDLDLLSNSIDSVSSANKTNDASRLALEIELLKNAIKAIKRLEAVAIDNIL